MTDPDPLERIKHNTEVFGTILWETLTPFERERILKRITKQLPDIEQRYKIDDTKPTTDAKPMKNELLESREVTPSMPIESDVPQKFHIWDLKTKYRVAFADMIEQRTTIMKFLLTNYGIEAVEEFFLHANPEWAEKLKIGKMKKIFAKMISKLAPSMLMKRLAGIVVENAQYLVGIDHIVITEVTDDYESLEITNCPVLKQFKKTLKALKFNDLEKRFVCSFACVPVLSQMVGVGNCNVTAEYIDKGCQLFVRLKAKEMELKQGTAAASLRNGPSQ